MKLLYQILLRLVIAVHFVGCFVMLACLIILPFKVEWYLWIPLSLGLIPNLVTPCDCWLSVVENKIRRSLGMPKVDGFIGHYILNRK
jgi:hypothetical protein